jgi:hypothetical protein
MCDVAWSFGAEGKGKYHCGFNTIPSPPNRLSVASARKAVLMARPGAFGDVIIGLDVFDAVSAV